MQQWISYFMRNKIVNYKQKRWIIKTESEHLIGSSPWIMNYSSIENYSAWFLMLPMKKVMIQINVNAVNVVYFVRFIEVESSDWVSVICNDIIISK